MRTQKTILNLATLLPFLLISACNLLPKEPTFQPLPTFSVDGGASPAPQATVTFEPTATVLPPRVLNVCLGQEPQSLFLYQASSQAARSVLQAIYDGPVDVLKDGLHPVILSKEPSLADGDVKRVPVDVSPGALLVDATGALAALQEGTRYYPAGCTDTSCVQSFTGNGPVQVDQLVIHFTLLPGLTWSDGAPLTMEDSHYSYEVAQAFFSPGQYPRLDLTASYQVVDSLTVAWYGVPGYWDTYPLDNFFSPLPRHLLGDLPVEELAVAEQSARAPIGWGAYIVESWVAGDHITLRKNPAYFRAAEGLPYFDNLVYRFVKDGEEALDALLAGECDVIDQSAALELHVPRLAQLQEEGSLTLAYQQDMAWELAAFGIESLNPQRARLFAQVQVRQAIAMCIDRQQIVDTLLFGRSSAPDSYVPASHPLHAPGLPQYAFDPQAASELLQQVGWVDSDNDPSTPRTSLGVPDLADGTPLEFPYLVAPDAERSAAAQIIQESLAQCGVKADVVFQEPAGYLAAGPAGPVFGRDFAMAQFALPVTLSPACAFFTQAEIPGPYPAFQKSWAGMNVTGHASPALDAACQRARTALPGSPAHQAAHFEAQAVFAQELPAVPLYTRFKVMASRPNLCALAAERAYYEIFWNLEMLEKQEEACQP
ncbi:MAG: ABC transporter substrate-binding protein [Chloroflexota bacterium]